MDEEKRQELIVTTLKDVLTLQQQHYQHIETERYMFMTIYTAIVGVMVGFIFKTNPSTSETYQTWSLLLLIFLTFIGFFINVRWMQTLKLISSKIQGIAQKLGIEEEMEFEAAHQGIGNYYEQGICFFFITLAYFSD